MLYKHDSMETLIAWLVIIHCKNSLTNLYSSVCVLSARCKALAGQWVDRLEGEGSCNLLDALRVGLSLHPHVDTIVIILHTQ